MPALLAALLLAATPMPAGSESATFSAVPSRGSNGAVVRVGYYDTGPGRPPGQWFERETKGRDGVSVLSWTTAKECPAVSAVYRAMDRIELPRLTPPGSDAILVVADGTWYTLERDAFYKPDGQIGRIRLESNVGTALSTWIDAMMKALAPCWSQARPPAD